MDKKLIAFEKLPAEHLSDKITRRYVHGEKAMFVRFELKKGAIIPEHQHPNEQITYILSGSVRVTIAGEDWIVKKGEVVIIPSNVPHAFEALEDTIDFDLFSPPRQDWLTGDDTYLRK